MPFQDGEGGGFGGVVAAGEDNYRIQIRDDEDFLAAPAAGVICRSPG
jgi:hypothetical protein